MHHSDRPRARITHDLNGRDRTPVTCGPEDLKKLSGGVRGDA